MIISQLAGGLGNQMFRYALGRALSLNNDTKLLLDLSPYRDQSYTDTKREYELDVFKLPAKIATAREVSKFVKINKYLLIINKCLRTNFNPYPYGYIKEKKHGFDKEILNLPDNVYISGWWQSEKYFIGYEDVIRRDFSTRTTTISARNAKIGQEIMRNKSVSIHIRRTDYITNKNANAYHGVCDLSYYRKAMKYIEERVGDPVYYIFSDDPVWTKKNIKSKHKSVYISHNKGKSSHEDIRLMSLCKHNIIANSSFSWWGAWLNENTGKIVISPKKWFQDDKNLNTDLIPVNWRKV